MEEIKKEEEMASRRDDPNYGQLSGYIPKELVDEFKIQCIRRDIQKADALAEAIAMWIENGSKGAKKKNDRD
ncbi:MAG: hypothetical protein LRZ84_27355 [Desertifilum sp.]|nr:hypothetical protein [Desertifilum sp.]